ncbi:MAG: class I SAM-dependent methyltransferase [Clostridia bacterium]
MTNEIKDLGNKDSDEYCHHIYEVSYSQKISERQWNLLDKGKLEAAREQTFIDDIMQKSHIEKELLSNLDGIETVFDGGAGAGRFSILLARHGCKVTHFDISQPMLDKAAELAQTAGVINNITFVKGALEDLSAYADRSFDLVMSFDAPVSYTWPNQEKVITNLVRICKKRIMLSVYSRLGWLPYLCNPIQKLQFILDDRTDDSFAQWYIRNKESFISGFKVDKQKCMEMLERGLVGNGETEISEYEKGGAPWPISYGFLPDELTRILCENGVNNIRLAGPGAYARTIPNEILRKIMKDPEQKAAFLEFCHTFDQNPYVCGMGKDNLFAAGEIKKSKI